MACRTLGGEGDLAWKRGVSRAPNPTPLLLCFNGGHEVGNVGCLK